MPLSVTLKEVTPEGIWKASGVISKNDGKESGEAEVLLQEIGNNKMKLVLDSRIAATRLFGKEVILYTNVPEVEVNRIAPGAEVNISKFWFNVK